MDHLLLGFDATPAAWDALDHAAALAADAGADVTAVHVVPVRVEGAEETEPLRLARAALEARGVRVHTLLAEGNAGEQLERFAIEGDFDAIVVGSPPAGPLERLLAGSVALHLACHAPITVVIARRG
jgi:nucleotide-binding universal stress UspA family protein